MRKIAKNIARKVATKKVEKLRVLLQGQLDSLNTRLTAAEASLTDHGTRLDEAEADIAMLKSDLASLTDRVAALESKTSQLDAMGKYTGTIEGTQVNLPAGCFDFDPAVWQPTSLGCRPSRSHGHRHDLV